MKTTITLIALPLLLLAEAPKTDLSWVDKEIAAIKPPRKGIPSSTVASLNDPFAAQLLLNQPPSDGEQPLPSATMTPDENLEMNLQAIVNKSTARIDGSWYHLNDKVDGYTVKEIEQDAVLLQKGKKKLKLSLLLQNDQIKINVK